MGQSTDHNPFPQITDKYACAQLLIVKPKVSLLRSFGFIFLVVIACMFLPWTQNVRSTGQLTAYRPQDRPQTIHSIIAGRIDHWYVREGQYVKKGDTIMVISEVKDKYFDPEFLVRINEQINSKEGALGSTRNKADALSKQIKALQDGLRFSLIKGRVKVKQAELKVISDSADFNASRQEYELAKVQLDRMEKLYAQGLKSLTELEQRRFKMQETAAKFISWESKLLLAKNELRNSQIELNSLEAEYLDKISKAESELSSTLSYFYDIEAEISKMNNEYANMKIRSSFYCILAPQNGYIVKALKTGIGETIKEGEELISIMPDKPQLAAALFVRPIDVPLLKPGNKVRIQFEGWPALVFSGWPGVSFGTFGGIISVIDQVDTDGKYRVLVIPDESEEPWPYLLRVGSGVYGWCLLKDVSAGYEIWRNLNAFPPDFPGNQKDATDKKKK